MVCIWLRSSCSQIPRGLLDLEALGWGKEKSVQDGLSSGRGTCSVRRWACFQFHLVSLEKREEEESAIRG